MHLTLASTASVMMVSQVEDETGNEGAEGGSVIYMYSILMYQGQSGLTK